MNTQIRKIAWNSLSALEKSTVINSEKAFVTETTYMNNKVYSVTFNTVDDALLGPIVVYIDKNSLVVLGKSLRM